MRRKSLCVVLVLILSASAAVVSWAQGPRFQGPRMFGAWEPKVGSGAAYRIESKTSKQPTNWEWAIVGTEKVGPDTGYWLEMYSQERGGEAVVMKQLMVWHAGESEVKRMIFQSGDQPPMEMPVTMMRGGRPAEGQKDVRQTGRKIGTETVTTPGGTFVCEHWQDTDRQGTHDLWISKDVAPFGLVKGTSPDTNITLTRLITNAQTRIKGQPRSLEEMMREMHRNQ